MCGDTSLHKRTTYHWCRSIGSYKYYDIKYTLNKRDKTKNVKLLLEMNGIFIQYFMSLGGSPLNQCSNWLSKIFFFFKFQMFDARKESQNEIQINNKQIYAYINLLFSSCELLGYITKVSHEKRKKNLFTRQIYTMMILLVE